MNRRRCAIYTRKSHVNGLEQDFNSLDAQREACEAYILSQSGEGWRLVKTRFDDGAFSGGTMDRPALKRLLVDIQTRKIDTVVVYKVDRLTRSLADFARMVELFDRHGVSFISITQQFNTTSSMGRLMLNVLLSFAQFEREVTGERIRDKIGASKKRGMWMGGVVPLGYDSVDKRLVINLEEAVVVRALFRLYLDHASVRQVKNEADRLELRTKMRRPNNGERRGGEKFTQGHIYKLLSNPIYAGEVAHKGKRFPGLHEPIIDRETWVAVGDKLKRNAVKRRSGTNARGLGLLAGLIVDEQGKHMVPSHACKAERRYRYYISKTTNERSNNPATCWRFPAQVIDRAVLSGIASFLRDGLRLITDLDLSKAQPVAVKIILDKATALAEQLVTTGPYEQRKIINALLDQVGVEPNQIRIQIRANALKWMLEQKDLMRADPDEKANEGDVIRVDLPVRFKRRGVETKLIITDDREQLPAPDANLIVVVAHARKWFDEIRNGDASSITELAEQYGKDRTDVGRAIPLAFLAPDIVEAILEGRQPIELTAARLKRVRDLPASWVDQRRVLGFGPWPARSA